MVRIRAPWVLLHPWVRRPLFISTKLQQKEKALFCTSRPSYVTGIHVLSHALKSRGLENNNVSSRIVPQFEVKATSALSGIVEEVVSTSSSPSFFFEDVL